MDPEYAKEDYFRYNTGYDYSDPRLDFGRPRTADDVRRLLEPPRSIRVKDSKGRTLRVGDHVRGYYNSVPYTGTVTVIGSPYPNRAYREIKVERNDDGKTQDSFSDAVEIIGNNL